MQAVRYVRQGQEQTPKPRHKCTNNTITIGLEMFKKKVENTRAMKQKKTCIIVCMEKKGRKQKHTVGERDN